MRALVVLYCYPPLFVPAAICYMKLMAGLVENGVEVEIVTIAPDSFQSFGGPVPLDEALGARAPASIINHEVRSPETSFWVQALKRLDPGRRLTYRWLEPKKREWTWPALRLLQQQDLSRFDVVMTCSQPHTNHLLGLELQRRTGLPWIAYFSDPWTDNPYYQFPSPPVLAHNRRLEDEILASADLVLFTCEEMKNLVLGKHPVLTPERSGVLPHAFIGDWYGEAAAEPSGPGALRLLQTGSFYGPRTPLPLIDALRRIAQDVPLPGRLRIDSYGLMDEKYQRAIEAAGLHDVFVTHGFVPYLDSLALMRAHDALLLIDAPLTTTNESVFLPSKLVDYLGSHRPVLAITPERGATARVVRETGGLVCPLESPEQLDGMLRDAIEASRVGAHLRSEAIDQYEYRTVGSSLAGMMHAVCAQTGARNTRTS